ncbi:MAG: cob(I)yrinic acid a,c-diamide adenosyltransferase [Myxococcales bacterium]|nr:cob(I)yrinic acid a,c-diamide adenosyltransferase [Myxococcales bacterium]
MTDTNKLHAEQMQQLKKVKDAEIRSKKEKRGVVVVNTGDGKGKSSAAFGVVIRALGHGQKVAIVQFIKGTWKTGEGQFFDRFPEVTRVVSGDGFTWETQNRDQDIAAAERGFAEAQRLIEAGEHDVVVLDELNVAAQHGYLNPDKVAVVLRKKPAHVSVIVTGRGAPVAIIDAADTVTEMLMVKHAFEAGIRARKGVEF